MNIKKGVALAMSLLILLTTVLACGPADPVDNGERSKPEKTEGEKAQALALVLPGALPLDLPNNTDLSDAMRRALWAFAGKTAGPALTGQGQENSLYSPVSLYYALAILEAGAAGETKAGLKSFMESEGLDLGQELSILYALMTRERDGSVEDLANGIWIREDLLEGQERPVKQDWLDYLSRHLYASAFAVDFSRAATAEQMSDWVAEATHGKIKPDIQLDDPLLYMVLMNTLYFQAEWSERFDPTPLEEDFYPEEGAPVEASYLTKIYQQYSAQKTDQYAALAVALKNGSISFVLPAPGISPQSLLEDPDLLVKLWEREGESLYDVDLQVPVFKYQNKLNLLDSMADLGLTGLVEAGADFSAMFDGEIWVSGISQEAFIALDEKGIEAAAYTEVHMAGSMPPQPTEELQVHLNRPFLYVIWDNAGAPLFVGIIQNPLAGDR